MTVSSLLRPFLDVSRPALVAAWICASGAALAAESPIKVAVYDVPPYGYVEPDGAIEGASVDLWRRAAGSLRLDYRFVPVKLMEDILTGLERHEFDVGIGAITITPERLQRVDFSYPAHRSGVAVALRRQAGVFAALQAYVGVVTELSPLVGLTIAMLVAMGVAMWLVERPRRGPATESEVSSLRDGVYWAVVTMTTVGYGDKTPKTTTGRGLAIVWMMVSVALVSFLSTSIVSKMTADQVTSARPASVSDLIGKRLAAVAHSSGAEFLDDHRLAYKPFADLPAALTALAVGDADAVVNSIGALRFAIANGFGDRIEPPQGVIAPAFMAFALPQGSALTKRLDEALVEITASSEWRRVEASYFAP